jgi:hypothetical protein
MGITAYIRCTVLSCAHRLTALETKTSTDVDLLRSQVNRMYQRSRNREYPVVFMVLHKYFGDTCKAVIECVLLHRVEERKQHWISQGFVDQKDSVSVQFSAVSKQKYKITASDSIKLLDCTDITLQFHPRMDNFRCCCVELKGGIDRGAGHVHIYRQSEALLAHAQSPCVDEHLTNIAVELVKPVTQPSSAMSEHRPSFIPSESQSPPTMSEHRPSFIPSERQSPQTMYGRRPSINPSESDFGADDDHSKLFTGNICLMCIVRRLNNRLSYLPRP